MYEISEIYLILILPSLRVTFSEVLLKFRKSYIHDKTSEIVHAVLMRLALERDLG